MAEELNMDVLDRLHGQIDLVGRTPGHVAQRAGGVCPGDRAHY